MVKISTNYSLTIRIKVGHSEEHINYFFTILESYFMYTPICYYSTCYTWRIEDIINNLRVQTKKICLQ